MFGIIFSKRFCSEEASGLASETAQGVAIPHVKGGPFHALPLYRSHQCPLVKHHPGTHLRPNRGGVTPCYGDTSYHEDPSRVSGYREGLALGVGPAFVDLEEGSRKWIGAVKKQGNVLIILIFIW